ncbi:SGNH/GDSL hydrolase family protein [Pseudochryseolinea flava]|uniref:Uncharacterized protein n=1 Tax=Pseudochryseolinea flava TaxID=2059302 RepID=A0A364XXZ8_9BACT|nr:hypothetical protein [Pseudochryseolinea flava]RAV98660.1 hypothetical protein DQQ10_23285 [Pseudochryseolinea flava]
MSDVKVAWIIGTNPVSQRRIRERGYKIRLFKSDRQMMNSFDEYPDLIIFSEAEIKDFTILFKIREFFPGVVILSLPPEPVEVKSTVQVLKPLAESMDRLIDAIRKIEDE